MGCMVNPRMTWQSLFYPATSLRIAFKRLMWISLIGGPLTLLPLMIFGLYTVWQHLAREQSLFAQQVVYQGNELLRDVERDLNTLADMLTELDPGVRKRLLAAQQQHDPRFIAFYILDAHGQVVEQTLTGALTGLDRQPLQAVWQALSQARPMKPVDARAGSMPPTLYVNNTPLGLLLAVPLGDTTDSSMRGALVAEVELSTFQNIIKSVSLRAGGQAYVVDQQGLLIAHPNLEWVQQRRSMGHLPLVQQGLAGNSVTLACGYDPILQRHLVGSALPMHNGWIVVITQPLWHVFQPILPWLFVVTAVLTVSLLVFWRVQNRLKNQVIRPLLHLSKTTERLATLDIYTLTNQDAAVAFEQLGSFQEMIKLGMNFNLLIGQLRASIVELTDQMAARLETEAQLRQAHDQLQAHGQHLERLVAQRTAALTRINEDLRVFAHVISHDLKSPLLGLRGLIGELNLNFDDLRHQLEPLLATQDHRVRTRIEAVLDDCSESLNFMGHAGAKMAMMLGSLVELEKLGRREVRITDVNVRQLIDSVLATLHYQIAQSNTLIHIGELPNLSGDPDIIELVFRNLLTNALTYQQPGRRGEIWIDATTEAEWVTFHVRDNGRGIDPHDLPKIFAPFYRGYEDCPGEGVGLSYVQAALKRIGGTITVESQWHEGSTFSVRVPLDLEAYQARTRPTTLTSTAPIKILNGSVPIVSHAS